jgi:hypothetical protein
VHRDASSYLIIRTPFPSVQYFVLGVVGGTGARNSTGYVAESSERPDRQDSDKYGEGLNGDNEAKVKRRFRPLNGSIVAEEGATESELTNDQSTRDEYRSDTDHFGHRNHGEDSDLPVFSGQPQLVTDQLAKALPDFSMPGHWSSPSVCRIMVDVVPLAMAQQVTASLDQLTDELLAFHTSSSTSFDCAPVGIGASSPSRIKAYASSMLASSSSSVSP